MKSKNKWKTSLILVFFFAIIIFIFYGLYKIGAFFFQLLNASVPEVSAAIIAGVIAVLSSVFTVVLARYFEAKKDREVAHRDKKIGLYDDFLKKLFEIFSGDDQQSKKTGNLVPFLHETHRKLVLWSGPRVIKTYAEWNAELTSQGNTPKAKSMIKMVDLFLAIRRDLGHSNKGIKPEYIIRFILKNTNLFMTMYKENPNVTFEEIAAREKDLLISK
ncbi:MAG: hypothetical protein ABSF88_01255 [Candidatus Aminicenantales bacterium]